LITIHRRCLRLRNASLNIELAPVNASLKFVENQRFEIGGWHGLIG
jgi:hypothetical protein